MGIMLRDICVMEYNILAKAIEELRPLRLSFKKLLLNNIPTNGQTDTRTMGSSIWVLYDGITMGKA